MQNKLLRAIFLAPMEGLIDAPMRDVLTRISPYDYAVSPFVRVSENRLPLRTFKHICPELLHGSKTASGTPVITQLLGQYATPMAQSAAHLTTLSPAGIDLNFGCPAQLVNRHGAGASLLETPQIIGDIVSAVRKAIPYTIPFSVKIRLGINDTTPALACAKIIAEAGADYLVVHARTRADGYKLPARWEWFSALDEAIDIPIIANGDIRSLEDYKTCIKRIESQSVMSGRQAVADPFLVSRIKQGISENEIDRSQEWQTLLPYIADYWFQVKNNIEARHVPGRLKLWLSYLQKTYTEAQQLMNQLRVSTTISEVESILLTNNIPVPGKPVD